jgi:hypothetical protein
MLSPAALIGEIQHYQSVSAQLRQDFTGIDDETLADTLEGFSLLPDLLGAVVRSSLEDEALAAALKARVGDMKARLERLEHRQERKRQLVCGAMTKAGMEKLHAEDFSVSLRQGTARLEITDEGKIPPFFLIPQPPKVDRTSLLNLLKRGEQVPGAELQEGAPHIQVRTK